VVRKTSVVAWLPASGSKPRSATTTDATGVASFTRRSTVSLSGGFGEVRLGRDYTPTFWNDTVFDPFGTSGVGGSLVNNVTDRLALATNAGLDKSGAFGKTGTFGAGADANYVRAPATRSATSCRRTWAVSTAR
jgi:predicted porin